MARSAGQIRPWRYLAGFAGILALLYVLVFFTGGGDPSPKLGIDLKGGTRVTLTARTETGQAPTNEQLQQAKQIIDDRVNGTGVSGAEVVLDGNNITITIPGDNGQVAKDLGQTAQLRFRPVPPQIGGPYPAQQPAATSPSQSSAPSSSPSPAPQGAPVPAFNQPAQTPTTPTPAPAPDASAGAGSGVADPQLAAQIAQAKLLRQSTDPNIEQQALVQLDCAAPDPLRGYDDPTKPLVTCNRDGTEKYLLGPVFLDGTLIADANAVPNPQGAGYLVNLSFKPEGADIWGKYTSAHVQQAAAFVLDSKVVSAPTIQGPIFGDTQITGNFSQAEAQKLASVLKYGSLPLSFAPSEAETVSATLGLASLQAGLIAGGIGLLLVFVYCLIYYRALGVLTILSLVLSGAVVYAVLVLLGRGIGFTLDLAGVAGFIVAIGITADSFVVFFERLKDEVREGRSFRSAVPRAWVRARRTILSADAVSFLASAVLYLLAVGQVKGFAFTLGMATVLDLLVVFLVTHPLVALAANSRIVGSPSWSGLGAVARLGAQRRQAAAARRA
ncbi:MAG: protein-export rane protein SecD [Pseudonocardia sp.]|nr:protein-export rane protein SecD [Pseudonocardia sp.]